MSHSSIVIIQGTVGLYTVATRCHTCFAVTLKYTEDSSLTIIRHSLASSCIADSLSHTMCVETNDLKRNIPFPRIKKWNWKFPFILLSHSVMWSCTTLKWVQYVKLHIRASAFTTFYLFRLKCGTQPS